MQRTHRILSLSLIFFFAAATISLAAEPRRFRRAVSMEAGKPAASAAVVKIPLIQVNPYDVVIPEEAGQIKEVYKAPQHEKVIVHVQDAHCNYEAQTNIAKIVEHLVKNYSVSLLAVEGSTGLIDTTPFRSMPNPESKKEVATYYMKKGRLTGPEFLSITGPHLFTIWGIENQDMYLNNYDAFLKAMKFQEEMKKYCKELRLVIDTLKARMYPPDLKEFDQKLTSYADKFESFDEYSTLLEKMVKLQKIPLTEEREKKTKAPKYKNFLLQRKAKYLEKKINFDQVDAERMALVDALGKVLDKDELSNLLVKSLSFRLAKITSEDYYDYLIGLVEKMKFNLKDYPNLVNYIEYSKAFHGIDSFELLLECEQLEEAVKETMYKNNDQRELNRLSRHLRILTQLFELSLSKEDVQYYNDHTKEFTLKTFTSFIDKHAPKYKIPVQLSSGIESIDANRAVLDDFYKYAMIRDGILVENTLKKMQEDNQNSVVMITGGFHTHGLTKNLKEKGISYIVISPRITREDQENPYVEVMTSQQNAYENMLTGFESGTVPEGE